MSEHIESSFDSGVKIRLRDEYKVTDLPESVGVNPSLLNAPIYVLHNAAAGKLDCIEVKWTQSIGGETINKSFRFIRAATDKFPTVTHAKYLDILLAMFSQNWNPEGILHFRYSDVLRIAGKAPVSRAREAIQQTILRYHRHVTEWENCWNGRIDTLTFNIIRKSSVIDDKGHITHKSPRRSKKKDDWHTVVFDPEVVSALKDEKKRILLTDLFRELKHDTFCVYRYYYGYPDFYLDKNGRRQNNIIWRNIDILRNTFKWTGQRNRFSKWLNDRFDELYAMKLIDRPIWNKDGVGIHCRNLKELKDRPVILESEGVSMNSPGRKRKLGSLTNEAVLEEFYCLKSSGKISPDISNPIELLLNNNMTDAAIGLIKSQIFN